MKIIGGRSSIMTIHNYT